MIKYRKEFPINQPKKFDNAVMNIIAQKIQNPTKKISREEEQAFQTFLK